MWSLFELGELQPETQLTGVFASSDEATDVGEVMLAIDEARDEAIRREQGRAEALSGERGELQRTGST